MASNSSGRVGHWSSRALAAALLIAPPSAGVFAQAAPDVVPGIHIAVRPAVAIDTIVYRRTITRDGRDTTAGTRTVVIRALGSATQMPSLEVVQRFPSGGGEIVDTAIAALPTMRAVAHRSHQPTKTMRFEFVGDSAEGEVTLRAAGADAATRVESVRQGLGGPIFDSNVIEMVVAALPLDGRFTAELPFFIYERGGRVPMAVSVRERTRVAFPVLGERDVWIVSVAVPGAPATIWVDSETRAVLRVRYDIAARAMSFTDDRVTPLPS